MNAWIIVFLGAMFVLSGCCGICGSLDGGDSGYYDDGSGGGSSYGDSGGDGSYYSTDYAGSDCWSSAGCTDYDSSSGTYTYEDYSYE